jgi:hypothetical protein
MFKVKTETIDDDLNPVWNETFELIFSCCCSLVKALYPNFFLMKNVSCTSLKKYKNPVCHFEVILYFVWSCSSEIVPSHQGKMTRPLLKREKCTIRLRQCAKIDTCKFSKNETFFKPLDLPLFHEISLGQEKACGPFISGSGSSENFYKCLSGQNKIQTTSSKCFMFSLA